MNLFKIFKYLVYFFPPETAHNLAIFILKNNLITKAENFQDKRLIQKINGLEFLNPVGMAAGFDKNAEVIEALSKQNFGFIESGTVTPKAQPGNPKPRLFRNIKDETIINRMGFNNYGKEIFKENFLKQINTTTIPLGINIGKNKNSKSETEDYLELLEYFFDIADYITINISSPNTPGLRNIQKKEIFWEFLKKITEKKYELIKSHKINPPIYIKIAPDNSDEELKDICDLALKFKIQGLIISNTTISRPKKNKFYNQQGGLSGKAVFELSNKILKNTYLETKGKINLIGVGGISNASDAYIKICNGASLIQIYSSLIYHGFGIVNKINKELCQILESEGHKNIKSAIGSAL